MSECEPLRVPVTAATVQQDRGVGARAAYAVDACLFFFLRFVLFVDLFVHEKFANSVR